MACFDTCRWGALRPYMTRYTCAYAVCCTVWRRGNRGELTRETDFASASRPFSWLLDSIFYEVSQLPLNPRLTKHSLGCFLARMPWKLTDKVLDLAILLDLLGITRLLLQFLNNFSPFHFPDNAFTYASKTFHSLLPTSIYAIYVC